jgi:hypothetical protein
VQRIPQRTPVAAARRRPAIARGWWEPYFRVILLGVAGAAALVLFATATSGQVMPQIGPMPVGWYALGERTGDYAVGTDRGHRDGGQAQGGGTIRSLTEDPVGLATLQQSVRAANFRGQRVRLSGFVKSGAGSVTATSALWMRVDGPAGSESMDLMQDRPILRGTDWARYDVVLDVPSNATGLSFGLLLYGRGQVWLDDVALERVGLDVPLTGRVGHSLAVGTTPAELQAEILRRQGQKDAYRNALRAPVNLSFTEGTRNARRP